jgi:catechol 2,3-dioxygenase-like lactoylglutathione lyase family enzyme
MRFTVDRLDHLVMNVADIEKTASWYQRVLGMDMEMFGDEGRIALKFGGQKINLRPAGHDPKKWLTGRVVAPGSDDLCFVTAVGPDDVVAHLENCGVAIAQGPVAKAGALGPMRSVYCRDPDGNLIEISSYLTE